MTVERTDRAILLGMRSRLPERWEDRLWYGLLAWNLAVLVYLVFRTPEADARWLYRGTLLLDFLALVWSLGNVFAWLIHRWQQRSQPSAPPERTRVTDRR